MRRLIMCLVGVVLSGAGCGMMKCAAFGIDPFQSLLRGLAAATGTSFGVTFLILGLAAVLFALRFARTILGIGTVFTLLLQGTATDAAARMLDTAFPDPSIPVRCMLFAAGYFLLALFSAMYFAAELGVSPYDGISRTLALRFRPASFKNARILTDFTCIGAAAVLLHIAGKSFIEMTGMIGIGTILTAALLGPLIEGIRRRWIDPLFLA